MRKLGILVMAMVLVLGMSFGVMAWVGHQTPESQGNRNDLDKDKTMPIKLAVDEMSLLEIPENAVFDLGTLNSVGGHAENNSTGPVTVEVKSNCPVTLTMENNFDPNKLGLENYDMDDVGGPNWVLSPALMVKEAPTRTDEGFIWIKVTGSDSIDLPAGINPVTMVMNMNLGDGEGTEDSPDYDVADRWTKMSPMEKQEVGNVTLTVTAQPTD